MIRHRTFFPTAGVICPRTDFDWRAHRMAVIQKEVPFPEDEVVAIAINSFGR